MYVYIKNRNQYAVSETRVTNTCVLVLVLVHSSCTKGKRTK